MISCTLFAHSAAALMFYKRACHLVPDIDFKLNKEHPPQSSDNEDSGDEGRY